MNVQRAVVSPGCGRKGWKKIAGETKSRAGSVHERKEKKSERKREGKRKKNGGQRRWRYEGRNDDEARRVYTEPGQRKKI